MMEAPGTPAAFGTVTAAVAGLDLSIIIVSWNVCELLRDCLQSLERNLHLPRERYETIVLDNASGDGSVEMLRREFPDITVIAEDCNLGFGKGCQRAYERCRGRFVLLLNPDTVVLDGAIDAMLAAMSAHPDAGAVGPRLLNGDGSFQRASGGAAPSLYNVAWNYLLLHYLLPRRLAPDPLFLTEDPGELGEIEWVSGAAMLLRREAIGEQIFDPAFFMYGEDMDLCDRLRRSGWKVLYCPTCSVVHHQGRSFAKQSSIEVLATIHKGPRLLFCKHHGPISAAMFDAVLLIGFLIRWPLFAIMAKLKSDSEYKAMSRFARRYVVTLLRLVWARK